MELTNDQLLFCVCCFETWLWNIFLDVFLYFSSVFLSSSFFLTFCSLLFSLELCTATAAAAVVAAAADVLFVVAITKLK